MRKLKIFLLMSAFIISFSLFSLPNVKAQANDFSRFTKENVITLSNGLNIIVRQPPAYFNPLTASDEELAYYFYPKRPNDPTELEEWKKRVNFNWIMPKFRVGKFVNPNTGEELDIRFAKTTTSYNWAGYVLNTTVARVSGNWTVPTITATSEN